MPKETVRRRGERGKREKRKNSSSKATGAGKIKATWHPGSTPSQRPASEKQSSLPAALSFLIPPAPAEHSPPNLRPIGHPHWAKTPIDVIRACPIRQYVNTGTQPRAGQSARTPLSFSLPRLVAGYTPSVPYRGVAIAVGARAESTGDPPSSRLAHAPLPRHRRYVSRQACVCGQQDAIAIANAQPGVFRARAPAVVAVCYSAAACTQSTTAGSCAVCGFLPFVCLQRGRAGPVRRDAPTTRRRQRPSTPGGCFSGRRPPPPMLCSAITNGSLPGRHNCGPTQTLI